MVFQLNIDGQKQKGAIDRQLKLTASSMFHLNVAATKKASLACEIKLEGRSPIIEEDCEKKGWNAQKSINKNTSRGQYFRI